MVEPKVKMDVLQIMILNCDLQGSELVDLIIGKSTNSSTQGFLYETLCIILISLKCFQLDYKEILVGRPENLRPICTINTLLCENIRKGNNPIDLAVRRCDETIVAISIKHEKNYGDADLVAIDKQFSNFAAAGGGAKYKLCVIVKNGEMYKKHRYNDNKNPKKEIFDRVFVDGLFFDKSDVIRAMDVFCGRARAHEFSIETIIDYANATYLLSPRIQLVRKLHQQLTLRRFILTLENGANKWCIAHKPRSGKSITMLLICKYLLSIGHKKILIMTSVPSTIDSFIVTLETWLDFAGISHTTLSRKNGQISRNFAGIVFCSTQYLKSDKYGVKKSILKSAEFDAVFIDESHHGSSTQKTKTGILDVASAVPKNAKLQIFASGTAEKTRKFYKIPRECVFEWEMDDEVYMNTVLAEEGANSVEYMNSRHTPMFSECLRDTMLNRDYTNTPSQVLMKHIFPEVIQTQILEYNKKNGTDYGFSFSSLLALRSVKKRGGGGVEYLEKFELAATSDGIALLKNVFEYFISNNHTMEYSLMKEIEKTQDAYDTRKSTREHPLLFIVYLPLASIALLQKTLKKFLKDHRLWLNYNIEYSSANDDSGDAKEEYNEFLKTIMERTKRECKIGCVLLLGNKGSVGITYHDCDVTISLDDGHSLDNQKQRYSRALTEAPGKKIGINVDMNVQRTYTYCVDVIAKYRKNTRSQKTNAEILQYLYEHKIFMFNPQEFKYGQIKSVEITNYYKRAAEEIRNAVVDDTPFLEGIICDDDMRDYIKANFRHYAAAALRAELNPDLEGEQPELPKGGVEKTEIDPLPAKNDAKIDAEEDDTTEIINKTYEMCKTFLFPLLALISRSYNIHDFKDIFMDVRTRDLIISLLLDKKIDLTTHKNICIVINIMNVIIDNNQEIVNSIREIYRAAPAHKLRDLIEKHFIPTAEEKQKNAEVPTPVVLVDEMLEAVPTTFWEAPRRVFEPCCGKGNFVLGIFERFYAGLAIAYPHPVERCRVIMQDCLYYADLTALNVFITTELLKCHIESKCGEVPKYEFYSHVGSSIKMKDQNELDIKKEWNIDDGFDAVIGNPPYNSNGTIGTGNTIWQHFTKNALLKWLKVDGYLVYVHPPGWRKPESDKSKNSGLFDLMTKKNQMIYLEIHGITDGLKVFKCGTQYDWYIIKRGETTKNTIVIDEDGKREEINMLEWNWLPKSNFNEIRKILAIHPKERTCDIIYSRNNYGSDKKWVQKTQTDVYKYPLIHSTLKNNITRYYYTNNNTKGGFGISKVIFGDSGINTPIIDMEGNYGMTEHAIAIVVSSIEEANNVYNALKCDEFKNILKSCGWSNYQIDWRMFKDLKQDFWREFL